jgi:carbonic anhydrase
MRRPAENVFGQRLGDLVVIRVERNLVAPSQVGSVEFAAEAFGTGRARPLHVRSGARGAYELERPRRADPPTRARSWTGSARRWE